jgi:HAE1 family hydrophobic/amphiphilic exporter-1
MLYAAYGTNQVSTIFAPENTYEVILEADPKYADLSDLLRHLMIRTASGTMAPLDSVAHVEQRPISLTVNHLGQLPAVTVSFNLSPGMSLGQASDRIQQAANALGMPASITMSFQGTAQLFQQALGNQGLLLFAAVLVVYIVLGILYESFAHPLTILSGLPSAGIGALLALQIWRLDLSVIAMIGLVMLIGIVKKNSIMIVDFALERRRQGLDPRSSVLEAARLRFRPIMMTTFAAIFGVLPIAIGGGAGSELRQPLGIAVVGGLLISQLLTLYITPAVFLGFERLVGLFMGKPAERRAHLPGVAEPAE